MELNQLITELNKMLKLWHLALVDSVSPDEGYCLQVLGVDAYITIDFSPNDAYLDWLPKYGESTECHSARMEAISNQVFISFFNCCNEYRITDCPEEMQEFVSVYNAIRHVSQMHIAPKEQYGSIYEACRMHPLKPFGINKYQLSFANCPITRIVTTPESNYDTIKTACDLVKEVLA